MINTKKVSVGEHRAILATKNIKAWLQGNDLPYHSPHKFRHGHIQYGLGQAKSIADYKAVSMNVMHASMEITDEIYSNLNDDQLKNKISHLGKKNTSSSKSNSELRSLLRTLMDKLEG